MTLVGLIGVGDWQHEARKLRVFVSQWTGTRRLLLYDVLPSLVLWRLSKQTTRGLSDKVKVKAEVTKLKLNKALDENLSFSYGTSPAIWDHTVTCHPTQVNAPRLNPSQ